MGYEQVDIYVEDSSLLGTPVPGVLVRVYDSAGTSIFTEAITDDDGKVGFLLWAQTYSLRFYKHQVGFTQPQVMEVQTDPALPPGTTLNAFTVPANILVLPVSQDPRLCRASGWFRDVTGAPRRHLDISFISTFNPLILDGSLVMDERRTMKTDVDGYGSIDLIRGAEYTVTIESFEDQPRSVRVPDSSSANLPDILFPVVGRVVLDAVSVQAGASAEVTPVVYDSAGIPLSGTARDDVDWSLEDTSVASMVVGEDSLVITGLQAGSTQLLAVRKDTSIIRIPEVGIQGAPVSVTVS